MSTAKTFSTINPSTEKKIKTYSYESWPEVSAKLKESVASFSLWKNLSIHQRAQFVKKIAGLLREHADEAAHLMALEMGKPLREGLSEIEKCAMSAEVLAQKASSWLADEEHQVDGHKHYTVFEPLGPILGIMPWNFPFWQVFRFALPTLLAGNTVLMKHADNVTGCSLLIEWLFQKAHFPHGVFQILICNHATAAKLIARPELQGVSLTGSVRAGQAVGKVAGASLKRVVMELGGSDPFVVLPDADISLAARTLVQGRLGNCGQSCVAPKRVILHEQIYDAFIKEFLGLIKNKKLGNPCQKGSDMGPLVNAAARTLIEAQVKDAVKKGAKLLCGGKRPPGKGFFYPPTALSNLKFEMRVFQEEVFGPVISFYKAKSESEMLCLAFHPEFGLGSSVWTRDLKKGEEFARQMNAGLAFVNSLPKSDPHLSFGGIKKSGLGHELGVLGIRSFVNQKNLSIYSN